MSNPEWLPPGPGGVMKKIVVRKPGTVRLTGVATTLHCLR